MNISISKDYPKSAIFLGLPNIQTQVRQLSRHNADERIVLSSVDRQSIGIYHDVRLMDQLSCLILAAFLDINSKRVQMSTIVNDVLYGTDAIYSTSKNAKQPFKMAIDFTRSVQFLGKKIESSSPDGTKVVQGGGLGLVPIPHVVVYIANVLVQRVLDHLENTVFHKLDPVAPQRDSVRRDIRTRILEQLYPVDITPNHIISLHIGTSHPHKEKFQYDFQQAMIGLIQESSIERNNPPHPGTAPHKMETK